MKDTSKKALRRGHNEGNIRQRTDGRWEVRLSAGIDYKTGKPRRTSTCCNTRQEAIAILQQQAHEVRTQGWRDPMSVTLGEWYGILAGHLHEGHRQAVHLRQLPQLSEQALLCTGKDFIKEIRATHLAGVLQLQIPRGRLIPQDLA